MKQLKNEDCKDIVPEGEKLSLEEIERNIIKKYRKNIWSKFTQAIKEYRFVEEGDKIAVAISGGKDSLLMAKLFQELHKHSNKVQFELEFIAMDPGYHPDIRRLLEDNCAYLQIPVQIFESDIFHVVDDIAQGYPCFMCAKMRRGVLYKKTQELGCSKLALGHHFNDVIETTLLNMFYTGNFKTMLPRLKSTNYKGLELIRPMYFIEERYIETWIQSSGISPLNCACMVAAKKTGSKRYEIKNLIEDLKKNIEDVDKSIFNAARNVNMNGIVGWKKDNEKHSYLDFYFDD